MTKKRRMSSGGVKMYVIKANIILRHKSVQFDWYIRYVLLLSSAQSQYHSILLTPIHNLSIVRPKPPSFECLAAHRPLLDPPNGPPRTAPGDSARVSLPRGSACIHRPVACLPTRLVRVTGDVPLSVQRWLPDQQTNKQTIRFESMRPETMSFWKCGSAAPKKGNKSLDLMRNIRFSSDPGTQREGSRAPVSLL